MGSHSRHRLRPEPVRAPPFRSRETHPPVGDAAQNGEAERRQCQQSIGRYPQEVPVGRAAMQPQPPCETEVPTKALNLVLLRKRILPEAHRGTPLL